MILKELLYEALLKGIRSRIKSTYHLTIDGEVDVLGTLLSGVGSKKNLIGLYNHASLKEGLLRLKNLNEFNELLEKKEITEIYRGEESVFFLNHLGLYNYYQYKGKDFNAIFKALSQVSAKELKVKKLKDEERILVFYLLAYNAVAEDKLIDVRKLNHDQIDQEFNFIKWIGKRLVANNLLTTEVNWNKSHSKSYTKFWQHLDTISKVGLIVAKSNRYYLDLSNLTNQKNLLKFYFDTDNTNSISYEKLRAFSDTYKDVHDELKIVNLRHIDTFARFDFVSIAYDY